MYDNHTVEVPHVPSWLIFDQRYRDRYEDGVLPILAGLALVLAALLLLGLLERLFRRIDGVPSAILPRIQASNIVPFVGQIGVEH